MTRLGGTARDFAALLAGLAFGVSAVIGFSWVRGGEASHTVTYQPDDRVVEIAAPVQADPGAATPQMAIEQFLIALIDRDSARAQSLLAPEDRALFPTAASLQRSVRARIGEVVGFDPAELRAGLVEDERFASTVLVLDPSLDFVNGLTAPRAEVDWVLVESNGWRVSLAASTIDPDYYAEVEPADIAVAATEWLSEARRCGRETAELGETTPFRGSSPQILAELCAAPVAELEVGSPEELDAATAANGLSASFGSSVRAWARTVPLSGALEARLVLAPIGDRWIVIDVVGA